MSDDPRTRPLRTAAYALAASAIGVPLVVLLLTQAVLLQLDPAGGRIDRDPLTWIPCAIAAVVMFVLIARAFTLLSAAAGRDALRYPALIIQLQVGFAMAAVALLLLTPGI